MAWLAENRSVAAPDTQGPYLTEDLKETLRNRYFPRYPTKRAVLLPAFHLVQHKWNWIPTQAIAEIAEFLEVAPAEALDTASFYEEFWLRPKGDYLIGVCRSLACQLCDHQQVVDRVKKKIGVDVGETTLDKRFTLIEMECLGACGTAPVALINEALHENLTPEKMEALIEALPEDAHDYHDPEITWDEAGGH